MKITRSHFLIVLSAFLIISCSGGGGGGGSGAAPVGTTPGENLAPTPPQAPENTLGTSGEGTISSEGLTAAMQELEVGEARPENTELGGTIFKGPFVPGATIQMRWLFRAYTDEAGFYFLDDSNFEDITLNYSELFKGSQIVFPDFDEKYYLGAVEVSISGEYYNEAKDKISGPLTLKGVLPVIGGKVRGSVNIFTHILHKQMVSCASKIKSHNKVCFNLTANFLKKEFEIERRPYDIDFENLKDPDTLRLIAYSSAFAELETPQEDLDKIAEALAHGEAYNFDYLTLSEQEQADSNISDIRKWAHTYLQTVRSKMTEELLAVSIKRIEKVLKKLNDPALEQILSLSYWGEDFGDARITRQNGSALIVIRPKADGIYSLTGRIPAPRGVEPTEILYLAGNPAAPLPKLYRRSTYQNNDSSTFNSMYDLKVGSTYILKLSNDLPINFTNIARNSDGSLESPVPLYIGDSKIITGIPNSKFSDQYTRSGGAFGGKSYYTFKSGVHGIRGNRTIGIWFSNAPNFTYSSESVKLYRKNKNTGERELVPATHVRSFNSSSVNLCLDNFTTYFMEVSGQKSQVSSPIDLAAKVELALPGFNQNACP
jgi:hypothetical protein